MMRCTEKSRDTVTELVCFAVGYSRILLPCRHRRSAAMDDGVHVNIQMLALLAFFFVLIKFVAYDPPKPTRRTVAILVLGDVGRSPRMMYHAESFANSGFWTYLIGYKGRRRRARLIAVRQADPATQARSPYPLCSSYPFCASYICTTYPKFSEVSRGSSSPPSK
jgi:hypothetical protein